MPKLRNVSGKTAIKILCLSKMTSEGKVGTVVPVHEELKIGTLRGILIVFNKFYECTDTLVDHGCDYIGTDGGH